jgi:hypothetical protein
MEGPVASLAIYCDDGCSGDTPFNDELVLNLMHYVLCRNIVKVNAISNWARISSNKKLLRPGKR